MNKFLKVLPVLLGIILLLAIGFWYEDSMEINEEETAESTTTTSSEAANEPPKKEENLEDELQQKGDQLAEEYPNSLEFMVYDLDSEQTYTYTNEEEDRVYETASIVKVSVAMLLLHEKENAQEELTEEETERMSSMILSSDNDATSALLNESLGGYESLQMIFDELDMNDTTVNLENWGK
ncbi:MAG: hypothetical protein L0L10_07090 [Tetragenococcus sp.]|nr:hypothetical protein [Tetragenococcus sp.]